MEMRPSGPFHCLGPASYDTGQDYWKRAARTQISLYKSSMIWEKVHQVRRNQIRDIAGQGRFSLIFRTKKNSPKEGKWAETPCRVLWSCEYRNLILTKFSISEKRYAHKKKWNEDISGGMKNILTNILPKKKAQKNKICLRYSILKLRG